MTVQLDSKQISPVNVEARKSLAIKAGDTVRVHQRIQEKGKTRIQIFEGLVLGRKHGNEAGGTFTVRATHSGVGVERIFPLYSPLIDKIEIVRRSKVRRAKLYYIREKVARQIRRQLRNMKLVQLATESEQEVKAQAEKDAQEAEEKAQAEEAAKQEEEANKETEQAEAEKEETTEEKPEEPQEEEKTEEAPTGESPEEGNKEEEPEEETEKK